MRRRRSRAAAATSCKAHLLTLDGALGALLTVAFGAFLLAQRDAASTSERRRWMWVAWAAMAGATLSKGLIGIVIPGASLVLYSFSPATSRSGGASISSPAPHSISP